MKTRHKLEWLVAMKTAGEPMPQYHQGRYWQHDPRRASHLTAKTAERVLARLQQQKPNVVFAIVSIGDAVRLFSLQRRRGDTRSLAGPDDPGVPMLTAQSKD